MRFSEARIQRQRALCGRAAAVAVPALHQTDHALRPGQQGPRPRIVGVEFSGALAQANDRVRSPLGSGIPAEAQLARHQVVLEGLWIGRSPLLDSLLLL